MSKKNFFPQPKEPKPKVWKDQPQDLALEPNGEPVRMTITHGIFKILEEAKKEFGFDKVQDAFGFAITILDRATKEIKRERAEKATRALLTGQGQEAK